MIEQVLVKGLVEMTLETERLEWTFKILGNSSRLRLLNLLLGSKPLHVGEISEKLRMSFRTVSRNLKLLERVGFIVSQNKGTYVYYTIRKEDAHPDNVALLALVRKAFSKKKGSKAVALLSAAMFDPRLSSYLKILESKTRKQNQKAKPESKTRKQNQKAKPESKTRKQNQKAKPSKTEPFSVVQQQIILIFLRYSHILKNMRIARQSSWLTVIFGFF